MPLPDYTVTDQMGRRVSIPQVPQRIVSLVPSQSELLADLGLNDQLVGVTKFCIHPVNLRKEKDIIGGTKQVKIDAVLALKPDLVIGNKEENSKEDIESLEQHAPVWMSDIVTIQDSLEMILHIGDVTQTQERAQELTQIIRNELAHCKNTAGGHKAAYFIWKDPWMVAGANTFIDEIMTLSGWVNVFKESERYPEVLMSQLKEKKPDVIFLSSEPYPFKKVHVAALQEHMPNCQVKLVDGEMFSWYGSRMRFAGRYLANLAHECLQQ